MNGGSDVRWEWIVVIRAHIEIPAIVVVCCVLNGDLIENWGSSRGSIERCSPCDFVATVGEGLG